ncbi:glycosyltransferase, partial [bacterium]|nr:glycosyltransferase [bacterium]
MQPIRVAHVINSMEVGGAQTQVANLFRAVDRKQFDLRLICLAEKGAIGEQLESEGFPVVSLGKRTRIQVKMLRRLVEILRQWRPDIVHTTVFTANLWGRFAAILSGTPVLISHEQSTVSLEKWHRRMLDRTLSWKTDRILAVSQNLRR